jgi:hypothetical protein
MKFISFLNLFILFILHRFIWGYLKNKYQYQKPSQNNLYVVNKPLFYFEMVVVLLIALNSILCVNNMRFGNKVIENFVIALAIILHLIMLFLMNKTIFLSNCYFILEDQYIEYNLQCGIPEKIVRFQLDDVEKIIHKNNQYLIQVKGGLVYKIKIPLLNVFNGYFYILQKIEIIKDKCNNRFL